MEQDLAHSNHLARPLLVALVLQSLLHGNGLCSDFMSVPGQRLDLLVIAVEEEEEERFLVSSEEIHENYNI